MVPEGWRSGKVLDFFKLQRGFDLTKASAISGQVPVYSSSGLSYYHNEAKVKGPGIVTGRKGSVGAIHLIHEDFWPHDTTLWVCDFNGNDVLYVWYFLHVLNLDRLDEASSVPTLNRNNVHALRCVFPPLAEQKRIAEVLGVWDRAIAVAGQQLDLARTQKRALMQTLLTPTRRFPGFDGQPWKEVRLGDVGVISSAGVDKKTNPAEPEVRLLNFLDVFRRDFLYDKEFDHVVTAPAAKLEQCNVQQGDVFFTPSSETRDDLARSAVAMEDMPGVVYSYHVVRLRLTEDWDMNFRAFVFQSDRFQRQAYEKGDGSGQRYVISQSNFRDMTVFVPGKAEQALIGATLKAAADEITTLETQITRLQAEKKALMQQLLTGTKRLAV